MAGKLYLVATPIGNLGDMSPRAVRTLSEVDFIAAEDTRVSVKLLNHFDIKKPLVSYYEHNKFASGDKILQRILEGESCALITDAGMPAISDPGADMVELCAQHNVEVIVIPGACAVVSALSISGLPTGRFCFEGFLSTGKKARYEHLEELKDERRTMIFYEAPHKLLRTLEDMLKVFGDRRVSLCRELTKMHEEAIRTTLAGALEYYAEKDPRGEYVLVIEGAEKPSEPRFTEQQALEMVEKYRSEGRSLKESCKLAAADTGFSKNTLYNLALGG